VDPELEEPAPSVAPELELPVAPEVPELLEVPEVPEAPDVLESLAPPLLGMVLLLAPLGLLEAPEEEDGLLVDESLAPLP
jgi:hypothetical protein